MAQDLFKRFGISPTDDATDTPAGRDLFAEFDVQPSAPLTEQPSLMDDIVKSARGFFGSTAADAKANLPTMGKDLQLGAGKGPPEKLYTSVLEGAERIADTPNASSAPVRPEVRRAVESAFDAKSPQGRALQARDTGWQGQIARERAAEFERADADILQTPTGKSLDPRVEARKERLISAGEKPAFAERAAREGAAKGVSPGAEIKALGGTAQESKYDFETRALFDPNEARNGLNNAVVRGIAKGGLGAAKALSGYGEFLSDVYGLDNAASSMRGAGDTLRSKEDAIGSRGTDLERNFEGAVASVVQQLPLLLTGSQGISLAGMALQTFGQEYSDGRSKGQTVAQAAERAALFGSFEAIGEKAGIKVNLSALKSLTQGKTNEAVTAFLSNTLKREIPGELLTTTGQFATDKFGRDGVALAPNSTAADYFLQVKDTIIQTVMQGGIMAGGSKVVGTGINAAQAVANRRIESDPARALAQALGGGTFNPAGVDAEVSSALRTQGGSSNLIAPTSTVLSAASTERARLESMRAIKATAEQTAAQVQGQAVADIGQQDSVEGAIAATQRAVSLDSTKLRDEAMAAAGITAEEVQAAEQGAINATAQVAAGLSGVGESAGDVAGRSAGTADAVPLAQAGGGATDTGAFTARNGEPGVAQYGGREAGNAPLTQPATTIWTGRRGDGYATEADAARAMSERTRLRPAYDWTTSQNAEGRFVLVGQQRQGEATAGSVMSVQGQVPSATQTTSPRVTYAPPGTPSNTTRTPAYERANTEEGAAALREVAQRIGERSAAAKNLRPASEAALRELDARAPEQAVKIRQVAAAVKEYSGILESLFGEGVMPILGLKGSYGMQYKGLAYVNLETLANGDEFGNSSPSLALFNTVHETVHIFEKSDDPRDKPLYAYLSNTILSNARSDVVDARVDKEGKGVDYGQKEIVADVNAAFMLDPKFWARMYDLDGGVSMRRFMYKFMENATKLMSVVKGSRLDVGTFIKADAIDTVREVAAQVWTAKAKRGDSLFGNESTNPSYSSSQIGDNDRTTQGANDGQQGSERRTRGGESGPASVDGVRGAERADAGPVDGREAGGSIGQQNLGDGGQRRTSGDVVGGRAAQDGGADGRLTPLPGYDVKPAVGTAFGPDPRLVSIAERYAEQNGIELKRQAEYAKVDVARATRLAKAYADMPHAPQDAKVKEAYANLIAQTTAQYEALVDAGYKFWFVDLARQDNLDYIGSPWTAMRDMRDNQTMGVFPTESGFGSDTSFDPSDSPLLAQTGLSWPSGGLSGEMKPVFANDLFRAVHDAFGHGMEGAGFRASGEENAWQAHVRLFTGSAVAAITSETRGQNNFVNYGPTGAANRAASAVDTEFAAQKTGLMPEWTWTEGRVGDAPSYSNAGVSAEVAPDPRDAAAKGRWDALTPVDKLGVTTEVMDALAAKVFDNMGLSGWGVGYTSGMFEGGINPSAVLKAPAGTSVAALNEATRVFGYLLDQKGMVSFDENNTTSQSQAGFVKVVLPEGLSTDKIDAIRTEIAARVPQADGDTVRDGSIVYGNFSQWGDAPLTDEQFKAAILAAANTMPEQLDVAGPFVFHSDMVQAYDGDVYDPTGREKYLEGTRYASNQQEALPGRDGLRGRSGGDISRAWIENLARSTDTKVAKLVGDRGPRKQYGSTPAVQNNRPTEPAGRPSGTGGVGEQRGAPSPVAQPGDNTGGRVRAGGEIRGAVHYGKTSRLSSLSGAAFGTGIKGAEQDRLQSASDPRIKKRVYFYLPVSGGIPNPEAGLGAHVYTADLTDLYDLASQSLKLPGDLNQLESAILDAGYKGYVNAAQGTVVVLNTDVPVSHQGTSDKFNKVRRTPPPANPKKALTRTEGDMLVRRPEGAEVMQVISAQRAGLALAAPSFKMQYGEARVLASEAEIADQVLAEHPGGFAFGDPSYSSMFDDVPDVSFMEIDDSLMDESMSFLDDTDTLQARLQAEMDAEMGQSAAQAKVADEMKPPTEKDIADAGLHPEGAFDLRKALQANDRGAEFVVPAYAKKYVKNIKLDGRPDFLRAVVEGVDSGSFTVSGALDNDQLAAYVERQVAGLVLSESGYDLASACRKGTILKLAQAWSGVAKKAGAFKFAQDSTGSESFAEVGESMGAFKDYAVTVTPTFFGENMLFERQSDGRQFTAEIVRDGKEVNCCTMGLAGSGGLGTEFYAVMGEVAKNRGKRFVADSMLSGVNSYRRTEQAMSYALKTGDTGVLLPGPQNRVYGYNMEPKTQEDHNTNLARLALAGLRNVQELMPDVRRLKYLPETDKFVDSQGKDAEIKVFRALKGKEARAFGLGRSTIARAVLTGQIIAGDTSAQEAARFETPIAYSMVNAEMDQPVGEGWGEAGAENLNPNLRTFLVGSKIVHADGTPIVMYHGTGADIHAFRAKQAGAIFITENPNFAQDFAEVSADWMDNNWQSVLEPAQIERAKQAAIKEVMADKSMKMTDRKAMKQSILDGSPEGAAQDAMVAAAKDQMPSGQNIIPVVVRAQSPFDYKNSSHVQAVIQALQDRQGLGPGDAVTVRLVKESAKEKQVSESDLEAALTSGAWEYIESPELQAVIQEDLGHDSFYVTENGQRNLAVYHPTQLKSVFNNGDYSLDDDRLSYSRRAGPQELAYEDNYLVPEVEGAYGDNTGSVAVMPALVFAKDGMRREYPSMPVRIRVGQHMRSDRDPIKKQYGLQHRIENRAKDPSYRGYQTPAVTGAVQDALEVERATRDIAVAVLDAQTAYVDGAATKLYLHAPKQNVSTVLEIQQDGRGKKFWSVVTSMPSTREQMVRRYKAPTSVAGITVNGDRTQQAVNIKREVLDKLQAPGQSPVGSESYILDENGLLFHQALTNQSTSAVDAPKQVRQLQRDANGKIILNKRKVAEEAVSLSRADPQTQTEAFKKWFGDSKVVDADGRPMVVYHGSTSGGINNATVQNTFFTPNRDVANSYSLDESASRSEGQMVVNPVYIRIENLLVVDAGGAPWMMIPFEGQTTTTDGIAAIAKKRGHDGVLIKHVEDNVNDEELPPADIYITLGKRGQIKSAIGNNGDFDPANPGISYSRGDVYALPEETRKGALRRRMQDYFIQVQRVQDAVAAQGGTVNEQTNTYDAEVLSSGRTGNLAKEFGRQAVEPLMHKMTKMGIEFDELSLYAYAMHAPERNRQIAKIDKKLQDGGSGMTNAEAANIVQMVQLSGDAAKFEELHKDLMAITSGTRDLLLSEGLITPAEFQALQGYQNYIPLRGFELVNEDDKPAKGMSSGRGFNIRGKETIRALGRTSRAGQLIENAIADRVRTIDRSERNHVAKVFLNFVLTNPDAKLWEVDPVKTRKAFDRKTGKVDRSTVIDTEDTVSAKVGGQEIYIKVHDELLLRALKRAHKQETGDTERMLVRTLGMYTSLLRNTLTRYNPEFAIVNAARDFGFGTTAMLAALGEKGAAKFVAHYAGAAAVSSRYERNKLDPQQREWDRWFTEYADVGGMTSGFYIKDLEAISSDIREMTIVAGSKPKNLTEKMQHNLATRGVKSALRVLEFAGSVSENAARVAAYRTAREMGKSKSAAALIAKNLTTNFDRRGELGQLVNAAYVFYNAAVQGTHQTLTILSNRKVQGLMAGLTAAGVTAALMMASIGGDDPDDGIAYWDKIPAYVKERNFVIMLPAGDQLEGADRIGSKGRYLTIPVQYGLNIFHFTGYQVADYIRYLGDKSRGVSGLRVVINIASAFAGSFNPFGGAVDLSNQHSVMQAVLPSVGDAAYQFATGTNGFGREVAPFKSPFDTKPDSQNSNVRQAGGPSEAVAQWLNAHTGGNQYEAGGVDISAGTVDNVVRNLTGGTGVFLYDVLALSGKAVDRATGGDPDLYPRDFPILRRVYGETGGDVDQGIFYENRKQIQEAAGVAKRYDDAGEEMPGMDKQALASMNKDAGKLTRDLSSIRKQMSAVQRDGDMSNVEKRTRMRELKAARDRLTSEFNSGFRATMSSVLNAPLLADESTIKIDQ